MKKIVSNYSTICVCPDNRVAQLTDALLACFTESGEPLEFSVSNSKSFEEINMEHMATKLVESKMEAAEKQWYREYTRANAAEAQVKALEKLLQTNHISDDTTD